ncbi:MFS general substrate transporter [Aspergillus pseudoustus]|uniref:MFS general substrate transporter n=1 Tax=Aspergillus pseudoustus TaxID=1810923 RepID=A0ABR4INK7_9EURO
MSSHRAHSFERDSQDQFPPGTVLLSDLQAQAASGGIILNPTPTTDPNEPLVRGHSILNWPRFRKALNYGIACLYVLITFVYLDIMPIGFSAYIQQLGFTFDQLNNALATQFAGLATGCILFIPFVHRYGRRPVYLLSILVQLGSGVWNGYVESSGELIACNLLSGLGGAISETIVQITIADLFFVHQRGTLNGLFLLMQGSNLGWRWMWWITAILTGANLAITLGLLEETKYVPVFSGQVTNAAVPQEPTELINSNKMAQVSKSIDENAAIDSDIRLPPRKSYFERIALVTRTHEPIRHHFYQPLLTLITIPAVGYVAVTYGFLLANIAVINNTGAYYLIIPPYNFQPSSVGLFSLASFVGSALGSGSGGYTNDRISVLLAKRNNGIHESETRLYTTFPAAVVCVSGLLMYGLGLSYKKPWPVLAVGQALYAFGFSIIGDAALTYLTDSYVDIIGDCLVAVTFCRNALSIVILFSLNPWIELNGLRNVFIVLASLTTFVLLLSVPMVIWGKRFRVRACDRYRLLARKQPFTRGT